MTPEAALEQLRAMRDQAELARSSAVAEVCDAAADEMRSRSPRDTGEFAAAWRGEGDRVVNTTPYASDVHGGRIAAMVPDVLADLAPQFEAEVVRRLQLE